MAKEEVKEVNRNFIEINSWAKNPQIRILYYLFIPIFFFGLLGSIWMIPFPEIAFLKSRGFDIYLNWASIFIAVLIYIYLKLVPMLSYMILLSIGLMSYLIVQLEYYEQAGGTAAWIIFFVLFLIGLTVLWLGTRSEPNKPSTTQFFKFLGLGPMWVWHIIFTKFKIKH
jgi:hypothetical protein